MRLILVIHGHPNYEKDCLTALGQCQAEAAERLAGEGIEALYLADGTDQRNGGGNSPPSGLY